MHTRRTCVMIACRYPLSGSSYRRFPRSSSFTAETQLKNGSVCSVFNGCVRSIVCVRVFTQWVARTWKVHIDTVACVRRTHRAITHHACIPASVSVFVFPRAARSILTVMGACAQAKKNKSRSHRSLVDIIERHEANSVPFRAAPCRVHYRVQTGRYPFECPSVPASG